MRAAAAVKRAALGAAAVAAWAVAWGSVPDEPSTRWGPAAPLAAVLEAYPWLTPLVILPAALLGLRFLAGPPASRPRFAVASVLVAASLLPAVHAALTLALSFAVFGGVPHVQDSVVQLFQAKIFLSGALPEPWLVTVPAALLAGRFAYWYADFSFGPRLVFESYFALALLAAVALRTLREHAGRRLGLAVAVALAGSLPLWVYLTATYADAYWGVDAEESHAVAAAAAPDALVFVTGDYGGYLWRNDPRLERGPVFVRRRSPGADRRVEAAFPERVPVVRPWEDRAP